MVVPQATGFFSLRVIASTIYRVNTRYSNAERAR
jgi:hypothetical protein